MSAEKPRNLWELLERSIGTPALFLSASTTAGLLSGWVTGLVTAVSTNLMDTPAARPHILRMTRWFGLAGLVHGVVGSGIIAATGGADSYKNRAASGCAAGLAMGISKGSTSMACGLCLGLAALSVSERIMSVPLREGVLQDRSANMLEPVFSTDSRWIDSWKQHIQLAGDAKERQ